MLHFIVSYLTALKLKTGGKIAGTCVFFFLFNMDLRLICICEMREHNPNFMLGLFTRHLSSLFFFLPCQGNPSTCRDQMSKRFKVECMEIPHPIPPILQSVRLGHPEIETIWSKRIFYRSEWLIRLQAEQREWYPAEEGCWGWKGALCLTDRSVTDRKNLFLDDRGVTSKTHT